MKTLILLSIIIASCSVPKRAQRHYNKAIQLGVRCETTTDTLRIRSIDSLIIDGQKTYYYTSKDTVVHFNTAYVPKTRFQTRIEYRYKTKYVKQYQKSKRKEVKDEQKQSTQCSRILTVAFWLGILLVILFCLGKFIGYFKNYLK